MFERPKSGERALLVQVYFNQLDSKNDINEAAELIYAAGGECVDIVTAKQTKPNPKFYVNTGKLQEIKSLIAALDLDVVIFNHELSPAQERNVERELKCRALSRTGLILDIFAQRARTFEGKLQVELAQLEHMSTRLVRGWTHLERQKGGIGLRGPGETQLETDRRLLRARIKTIKARLEKVKLHRQLSRRQRQRQQTPLIALVGYTNAGKSTLFNAVTGADVFVANQLFATLDPTVRRIHLDGIGEVVLADTVGFVSNLPHKLVEAFHATLEESAHADLVLHVVDAHGEDPEQHIQQVNEVLTEIGANEVNQLLVFNKSDLLVNAKEMIGQVEYSAAPEPNKVWVCALNALGLDALRETIIQCLRHDWVDGLLTIGPHEGKLYAKLQSLGGIKQQSFSPNGGWQCTIRLSQEHWNKLCAQFNGLESRLSY